jgi:hypothetical protein
MKYLDHIDFLGVSPYMYIFRSRTYKTPFSNILSIISFITICTISFEFVTNLISRQQIYLVSGRSDDFEQSLNLNETPLLLYAATLNGNIFNTSVYYPIVQLWTYYPKMAGTPNITDLPLKPCGASDFGNYTSLFKDMKIYNHMCVDRTGVNFTLYGKPGDYIKGYSKLQYLIQNV